MAVSSWGVNDPEAVKLWSRKTMQEALKMTLANRFSGEDSDSLLQLKDETSKSAGDRITTILRMQLTGNGIAGDNSLEGNEESLVTYTQNVLIDQLRHAVRSGGEMSEQPRVSERNNGEEKWISRSRRSVRLDPLAPQESRIGLK